MTADQRIGRVSHRATAWLACAVLAACAPDSMRNYQATGYNAYLNTIATACNPLMLGINNVSEWLQNQGSNDPNYAYFLDQTSRLYYGTISADMYRQSITGFFGPGSSNEGSFACMFRNLPGQRPSAPVQQPGYGAPPPPPM
jgi:hypothetical protein